eukprot:623-Eustigmatos_ZCMA.PRE.1
MHVITACVQCIPQVRHARRRNARGIGRRTVIISSVSATGPRYSGGTGWTCARGEALPSSGSVLW